MCIKRMGNKRGENMIELFIFGMIFVLIVLRIWSDQ